MTIFKRAAISIKRTPIKTVILLVLMVIIGSVVMGAVTVRSAIHTTDLALRRQMPPIVAVQQNRLVSWDPDTPFRQEHVRQMGSLPYVEYYNLGIFTQLWSKDFKMWYPHTRRGITSLVGYDPALQLDTWMGIGSGGLNGIDHPNFNMLRLGFVEMIEGETFTESQLREGENVVVISRFLADHNGLTVGDYFNLYHAGFDFSLREISYFSPVPLRIIGLFHVHDFPSYFPEDASNWTVEESSAFNLINQIFIPSSYLIEIEKYRQLLLNPEFSSIENDEWHYWMHPLFVLFDPLELDYFIAAAQPYLPAHYQFTTMASRFAPISHSMEMMRYLADNILLITIAASVIILGLVIILFLYDRRQEMGIYLALGENRITLMKQMIMEVLLVTFIAIVCALVIGTQTANAVSTYFLQNELAGIQEAGRRSPWSLELDRLDFMGFPPPMSGEEMLEFYNFTVTPSIIIIFTGIKLAVVIFATLLPLWYLFKLSPKKILM